jgi:RecA-family ATPase
LPVAAAVKIVRLPGLPPKGDVSDWLDAGHTKEELATIVQATPILKAEDLQASDNPSRDKQLQWYTISQLREETSAEIHYLVDGLLAEASLSVIGGKIAVGKSPLARTLAYCVTHGVPFLGNETQQGPVLYVAPEESKHGVMQDLQALGFTDTNPLHLCFASSENVLEQVLAKMQETQARLVILETIFRVLKIKDVNDYAQSTAKLDPVLALARQTSAHVLFTHHLGKRDTTCEKAASPARKEPA